MIKLSLLFLLSAFVFSLIIPFTSLESQTEEKSKNEEFKCEDKIEHIIKNFFTDLSWVKIIAYSGKKINDLGAYKECKDSEGFYYLLMTTKIKELSIHLGLCFPNECPLEFVQTKKPLIAELISKVSGFEIKPEDIILSNPEKNNKELNKWSAGAIVFLIAVGLLIVFEIFTTVLEYKGYIGMPSDSKQSKVLLCFSYQKNTQGIFDAGNKIDQSWKVLNGVRVLAMWWIVIAHSFVMQIFTPLANINDVIDDAFNSFFIGMMKAATVSVDVFFFLSGLLAGLSYYQSFKNPHNRNPKSILSNYLNRYLRLTPLVLVLMLYTICIQPMLFDTPISPLSKIFADNCTNHWYDNLLYIANLTTDFKDMCNPWVWYLFVDFQLYIIVPIIMLPYCYKKSAGYLSLGILLMGALITQIIVCCYYNLNLSLSRPRPIHYLADIEYIKPYTRALPYLIGIAFFFLLKEGSDGSNEAIVSIKDKVYCSRLLRYSLYFAGILLMSLIICSFYLLDRYPESWNDRFGNAHIILIRPLFVIALVMVIYPVLIGRGKLLLAVLGHYIFNCMGKLTYAVYMIHLPIFFAIAFDVLQAEYYSIFMRVTYAITVFIVSYVLSFFVTIIFVSPAIRLSKGLKEVKEPKEGSRDYKLLVS